MQLFSCSRDEDKVDWNIISTGTAGGITRAGSLIKFSVLAEIMLTAKTQASTATCYSGGASDDGSCHASDVADVDRSSRDVIRLETSPTCPAARMRVGRVQTFFNRRFLSIFQAAIIQTDVCSHHHLSTGEQKFIWNDFERGTRKVCCYRMTKNRTIKRIKACQWDLIYSSN